MTFWTFSIFGKVLVLGESLHIITFLPHGGNTEPQDSYKGCFIPKN